MRTAFVTGGTGFIGRHLIRRLVREGYKVYALVRKPAKAERLLKPLGVELIYGDIRHKKTLEQLESLKIDYFFHCAGLVSLFSRKRLFDTNALGSKHVCELALKWHVRRMIYLSSIAVVAGNTNGVYREDMPYHASNVYGESKLAGEKIALEYRERGLLIVILRPPIVYGEEETHFIKPVILLLKCRLLPFFYQGSSLLHMVYVGNLIDAMINSLGNDKFLEGTFFTVDSEPLSVRELLLIFCRVLNTREPWNFPEKWTKYLLSFPLAGKRFRKFSEDILFNQERMLSTGFRPRYDVREAFVRTMDSFAD